MELNKCLFKECKALVLHTDSNCGYCSKSCKSKDQASERKRDLKNKMLDYLGAKCKRCGNEERITLCFHHVDPLQKKYDVSTKWNLNYNILKTELDKCILLCRNCHAIIHAVKDPEYIRVSECCLSAIYLDTSKGFKGLDKCTINSSEVYRPIANPSKKLVPRELRNYIE